MPAKGTKGRGKKRDAAPKGQSAPPPPKKQQKEGTQAPPPSSDPRGPPPPAGEGSAQDETQPPVEPTIAKIYEVHHADGQTTWTRDRPDTLPEPAENAGTRQKPFVGNYIELFNERRDLRLQSLVVQSDGVKLQLQDVFADYPNVNTHVGRLEFEWPFHPFIHRWGRLTTARDNLGPETRIRKEMNLLYDALYEELEDDLRRLGAFQNGGYLHYDFLWAVFEPGDNIIDRGTSPFNHLAGHERVSQICTTRYDNQQQFSCKVRYLQFDGKHFGSVYVDFLMDRFDGLHPITALPFYPLRYHPQAAEVRDRLIQRGRRLEEELLREMFYRHRKYNGLAFQVIGPPNVVDINSRVLIDFDACALVHGGLGRNVGAPLYHQLGDNERLLASDSIDAYSLNDCKWVSVRPEKLCNIAWDTTAFDSLVLPGPPSQKQHVLYAARRYYAQSQDNLTQNREAGLIIRLSGPSGSGKTFTAECVAENMEAPLFVLKGDELGETQEAKGKLESIIPLLVKWKGILLLKNMDGFLTVQRNRTPRRPPSDAEITGTPAVDEERNNHPNERVSMLLKMFEFHKIIIFLTTRHDNDIDPTLDAHVDLWVRCRPTPDMKRKLWDVFLKTDTITRQNPGLGDLLLNGRQIKAAATMALRRAQMNEESVTYEHVKSVLSLGLA